MSSYEYTLRSFREEAADVVARAREADRRILRAALVEAGKQKKQAHQQGFQDGLAQGREQGTALAKNQVVEQTRTLAAALEQAAGRIDEKQAELIHLARSDLLKLAMAMAERIVRARIEADPQLVRRAVDAAVDLAGRRRSLKVRLNPADVEAMEKSKHEAVEFVPDPTVERGGCVVETETSQVDAAIETQLKNLREAFLG